MSLIARSAVDSHITYISAASSSHTKAFLYVQPLPRYQKKAEITATADKSELPESAAINVEL